MDRIAATYLGSPMQMHPGYNPDPETGTQRFWRQILTESPMSGGRENTVYDAGPLPEKMPPHPPKVAPGTKDPMPFLGWGDVSTEHAPLTGLKEYPIPGPAELPLPPEGTLEAAIQQQRILNALAATVPSHIQREVTQDVSEEELPPATEQEIYDPRRPIYT